MTEDELIYMQYITGRIVAQPKGLTSQMALLAARGPERHQLLRARQMPTEIGRACFMGAGLGSLYARICLDFHAAFEGLNR